MTKRGRPIEVVGDRARAQVLMNPLRLKVLEAAREPASATEIARRLKLTPQKVNYHVRRLEAHGFLEPVEERRARNMVERVYRATAESYVLASEVLGGLSPGVGAGAEPGPPDPDAITLEAEFRLESGEQRALFERALRELVMAVVAKYAAPAGRPGATPSPGRPYRMLLECVPQAPANSEDVDVDFGSEPPGVVADVPDQVLEVHDGTQ